MAEKREITRHGVNGLNEKLRIYALDDRGPGNANHAYAITFYDDKAGYERSPTASHGRNCLINFQQGPIAETGVNGISNESLLAIVEDRLLGFQGGSFACSEDADALVAVQTALAALHRRTSNRVAQGVEGTSLPHTPEA